MIDLPRLVIIGGHYGAGKSECSVALALYLKKAEPERPVTVIDLDVVNPYFRSREARSILEAAGVQVIGNSLGIDTGVDLPAIPGIVAPALRDARQRVVVDLGGDPAGAQALRQFRPSIPTEDTVFLYVFNRNRPENGETQRALASMRSIEGVVGLRCGGIVNNTHMLSETTCEDLQRGSDAAGELAAAAELPLVFHSVHKDFITRCSLEDGEMHTPGILPIGGVLRQNWMNSGNTHTTRR